LQKSSGTPVFQTGPIALSLDAAKINEGESIKLTGAFSGSGEIAIDWGDGSTSSGSEITVAAGTFTATHTYLDNPTQTDGFAIRVSVTETTTGEIHEAETQVVVRNVAPQNVDLGVGNVFGMEGQTSTFALVGSPTDPGNDELTFRWRVLDPQLQVIEEVAGGESFTFTPQDTGVYRVSLQVDDGDGGVTTRQVWLHAQNTAPGGVTSLTLDQSVIQEDQQVLLTGTFVNEFAGDTHSVLIDWGDGFSETLHLAAGVRDFSATRRYADDPAGSDDQYPIRVTVSDDDGASVSADATVTVQNVAPTPAIDSISGDLPGLGLITVIGLATDPAGASDTLTFSWAVFKNEATTPFIEQSGVNLAVFEFTPDEAGLYRIELTVSDEDGGASTVSETVRAGNVAPVIDAIATPLDPAPMGAFVTVSGFFTDRDVGDSHTAVWSWGDGTTSPGTVAPAGEPGQFAVSGSHPYASAGVYRVTLTVTDDDGESAELVSDHLIVVYDPSAGFVTGGGWFNSPAGAYAAQPELTGRAHFGFVSRYNKGATVPTGQTQFQFQAGDLNFHSATYQWLVVAGARAQFKGTGTIGGAGDYGFLVTAIDGQIAGGGGTDKFRIKIWDRSDGQVVYDNQAGASEDSSSATELGEGAIIIHGGGQALEASSAAVGPLEGKLLSQSRLDAAVGEAVAYWAALGIDSQQLDALHEIPVLTADLPGAIMGLASESQIIWIDSDAAGHGWALNSPDHGMDLVQALAHELGHKLGYNHDDHDGHGLMAPTLDVGLHGRPPFAPDLPEHGHATHDRFFARPAGEEQSALSPAWTFGWPGLLSAEIPPLFDRHTLSRYREKERARAHDQIFGRLAADDDGLWHMEFSDNEEYLPNTREENSFELDTSESQDEGSLPS
jgi:PKD repeat protein